MALTADRPPQSGTAAVPAGRGDLAVRSRLAAFNAFLLSGLTLWLGLVTLNNLNDFGTNKALITRMLTMVDLVHDPVRGNGLEWRAMPASMATLTLIGVIIYEIVAVALLARAAVLQWRRARGLHSGIATTQQTNLALGIFIGLFLIFLCGGMWFGYWIYIGAAQQVHFTGLIIGLLATLLVNLPSVTGAQKEQ
jgi:predicted small integral membrane protein